MKILEKRLSNYLSVYLGVLIILAGCASDPEPRKPTKQADVGISTEAQALIDQSYLIAPGDRLDVFVWGNPEISSKNVPVRPDGKITVPLVEDVSVHGRTPTQVARMLQEKLADYFSQPRVSVIVMDFVGDQSVHIRVIGEASAPQALIYKRNMTLLDVMISVGGLTEFAAGNRARIVRSYRGKQYEIAVRIDDLIKEGNISANQLMMPGDILIIPESWF